jgi:hypothetical protein
MAITVTCAKCLTRFEVSEKFAGKSGPCPKCKTTIQIPAKGSEVVVHAPEDFGPKGTTGQAVFKPIARTETNLQTPQIVAIVGSILLVLIAAVVIRFAFPGGKVPELITILGAIALGPPLAFAGYSFLRDDELEPYRGQEMLLRALACGLVFAAIWGAYWFGFSYWFDGTAKVTADKLNWVVAGGAVAVMVVVGTLAAQAAFELEIGGAVLLYSMYLIATVLLRVIMGLGPRWSTW